VGNQYSANIRFTYLPEESTNAESVWQFEFIDMNGRPPGAPPDDWIHIYRKGDEQNPIQIRLGMMASIPNDVENGPDILGTRPLGEDAGSGIGFITFDPYGRLESISAGDFTSWGMQQMAVALNFTTMPRDNNPDYEDPGLLDPGAIVGGVVVDADALPSNRPQGDQGVDPNGDGNRGSIILDFTNLRQQGSMNTSFRATPDNGNAPGTLQDISIGADGIIMGRYSNSQLLELAQVPLSYFRNPEGLEQVGNNLFNTTVNSGAMITDNGEFIPGSLEMSNVDISTEFTEMITTQRGFQANTRIITTSDEILQETINLKR